MYHLKAAIVLIALLTYADCMFMKSVARFAIKIGNKEAQFFDKVYGKSFTNELINQQQEYEKNNNGNNRGFLMKFQPFGANGYTDFVNMAFQKVKNTNLSPADKQDILNRADKIVEGREKRTNERAPKDRDGGHAAATNNWKKNEESLEALWNMKPKDTRKADAKVGTKADSRMISHLLPILRRLFQ